MKPSEPEPEPRDRLKLRWLFSLIRGLPRNPIYRLERRHAFFGKRWLGPAARLGFVGLAYAVFIIAGIAGEGWVESMLAAGNASAFALAALTSYAAPGVTGAAVAREFDRNTAEALFLTPRPVEDIVFAKVFGRLSGLFETYLWMLPLFLFTPRPEALGSMSGIDMSILKDIFPPMRDAQVPIGPISGWTMLIGFQSWVQGVSAVYYAGALGLAFAMLVRSGKLAIMLSYIGMLFVAGTIMGIPIVLVMGLAYGGLFWMAYLDYPAVGIAFYLFMLVVFLELIFSILIPTWALRFACRMIPKHLDAAG